MLYQVLYLNKHSQKTRAEYVVSNNRASAEMKADYKLWYSVKDGFEEMPLHNWDCVKIKKMDDIPYREDRSQVFYV